MVSTDIPRSGVPQVNRHDETGLIVPPRDAAALAQALNQIAGDPALHARLARGAAASVRDNHAPEVVGRRLAEVIREALAGKPT